jgi:hypothetical protein
MHALSGSELPPATEPHDMDSAADLRYPVLPIRRPGLGPAAAPSPLKTV